MLTYNRILPVAQTTNKNKKEGKKKFRLIDYRIN